MRRYETIVIVDPDVPEDERNSLCDKIKDVILQKNGSLIELEEWGIKRLAYEIRKKIRGYYFRIDYCGIGELVDELERSFRINDRFLKFMTIMLADENKCTGLCLGHAGKLAVPDFAPVDLCFREFFERVAEEFVHAEHV